MAKKVNPAAVGIFVVGAILLIALTVAVLGTGSLFERSQRFLVYFTSNTNGLDEGADVRIGGVRIGKVLQIRIQIDPESGKKVIPVVIELLEGSMRKASAEPVDFRDESWFRDLIEKDGLKAALKSQSVLTGKRYVELDLLPDAEGYLFPGEAIDPIVQIPTVAGELEQIRESLTDTIDRIAQFDFKGISDNGIALLEGVQKGVEGFDLSGVGEEVKGLAEDVRAVVGDEKLKTAIADLEESMGHLKSATGKIDEQIEPLTDDVRGAVARIEEALGSVETAASNLGEFVNPDSAMAVRLREASSEISRASRSIRELADYLKRNPNSILTGKDRSSAR